MKYILDIFQVSKTTVYCWILHMSNSLQPLDITGHAIKRKGKKRSTVSSSTECWHLGDTRYKPRATFVTQRLIENTPMVEYVYIYIYIYMLYIYMSSSWHHILAISPLKRSKFTGWVIIEECQYVDETAHFWSVGNRKRVFNTVVLIYRHDMSSGLQ